MTGKHAGLRTCVGCRQRLPVHLLVRLHAVRGAVHDTGQNEASRDAILAADLVTTLERIQVTGVAGRPVAPHRGVGIATGKGAHMCPTLPCARRAAQILLRRPSGRKSKASGHLTGAEKSGDSLAASLLEQVAHHAARLAAARQTGLERRGVDPAQDAQLGVWEALQGRLEAEQLRGA